MHIEVIKPKGDLERERWRFYLSIDYRTTLSFDTFIFETKESTRHRKWERQSYYDRTMRRESTIDRPEIPQDVLDTVKSEITQVINGLEVSR